MDQITKRGTYKLVELPPDCKAITRKWVFCIKRDHNGKIVKYKARLIEKGFSQIPGIDFVETFAPVMRLETFRLLMALATKLDLLIHVVDVVGAYLNGTLQETIYMAQPPDYDDGTGQISLLIKALYGLRQAGQAWNNELNQSFLELEYTRLFSDQCVYICHQEHDLILAAIHTNDITMLGSDIDAIKKAKAELGKYFTITDLGEAKQVVGLELERNLEEGTLKFNTSRGPWKNLAWQMDPLLSMSIIKALSITQSMQLITVAPNISTYNIISSMRSSSLTRSKFSTAQLRIT